MSKKTVDRTQKKKKKKKTMKEISMVPMLYLGIVLILLTLILGKVFPNMPSGISTILYLMGIIALVVYMIQVAFEKRTGKAELSSDEIKELKKAQKKKYKRK